MCIDLGLGNSLSAALFPSGEVDSLSNQKNQTESNEIKLSQTRKFDFWNRRWRNRNLIPPESEWLTVKQVSKMYGISTYRVYYARSVGRENLSGEKVRLEMFHTFAGLMTTRKMVEEFLMRLNG